MSGARRRKEVAQTTPHQDIEVWDCPLADLHKRVLDLCRIWPGLRGGLGVGIVVRERAVPRALKLLGEHSRPGIAGPLGLLLISERRPGASIHDTTRLWGGTHIWMSAQITERVLAPGAAGQALTSHGPDGPVYQSVPIEAVTRAWSLAGALSMAAVLPHHVPTYLLHAPASDLADLLPGPGLQLVGLHQKARRSERGALPEGFFADLLDVIEELEAVAVAGPAARRQEPKSPRERVVFHELRRKAGGYVSRPALAEALRNAGEIKAAEDVDGIIGRLKKKYPVETAPRSSDDSGWRLPADFIWHTQSAPQAEQAATRQ